MENNKNYSFLQLIKDIFSFMKPYRGKFWIAFFLRFTSDLVWLYPTWALSKIVDMITNNPTLSYLPIFLTYLAFWGLATLYHFVCHDIAKYIGFQVSEGIALDAKLKTIRHMFSLDLIWHEKENSGNKLKRISSGGEGFNRVIRIFYINIIESVLNIIVISIIFFSIDMTMSFALLAFMVSYYFISYLLTKRASRQAYLVHQEEENLEGANFEALNNIRTIKSLGMYQSISGIISNLNTFVREEIRKRILYFRIREVILNHYNEGFKLLGVFFIGYSIMQGHFTIGVLILFIGYLQKIERATFELSKITNDLIIAKIKVHRMMDILTEQPSIEGKGKQLPYPNNWKTLQIQNLTFSYEGIPVLKNLSFTIKRGEKIGIVGLSGAGKSTLFKLLLDLYETFEGDIKLDNYSMKDLDRNTYIQHLAVVPQETELFNTSLKENIILAAPENKSFIASDLQRSVKTAQLEDVINNLPEGIDTIIGEKGFKLSGGEKQRVGIARALYRQPDLLLLDEATSHLDVDSEKKIQAALEVFLEKVTAIVIAHRLSTIQQMDKIIVLENGKILEVGTFDELQQNSGRFAELWEKQKL